MSRIVFLVHGMGEHPPGWSAGVRAVLDDIARRYVAFADGTPLGERVRFVEITYDHVFKAHVQRLRASFDNLCIAAADSGTRLDAIATWAAEARPDEHGFFWTHAVDVLLYHSFAQVREQARVAVMRQIAGTLADETSGGRIVDVCLIAHSLGTAVATDALALLATTPFAGSDVLMAGRQLKLHAVFTVANVAKEIATDIDPYTCALRPDSAVTDSGGAASYCSRYWSFRHSLDPFCLLQPFTPQWGGDFTGIDDLDHLHDFDVHALEHYLDHPRVHGPIINGIFGRPVVSHDELASAEASYSPIAGPCAGHMRRVREAVAALDRPRDVQELVIAGARFLASASALRQQCM